jgi:hypothetical protein
MGILISGFQVIWELFNPKRASTTWVWTSLNPVIPAFSVDRAPKREGYRAPEMESTTCITESCTGSWLQIDNLYGKLYYRSMYTGDPQEDPICRV